MRTDIQGLRAIAVSSVLVYHLWPGWLRGGYVGVDVFFVISGFLITSHLLAHPPDRPKALFDFWSRRVRRLLPAALLVLAATLAAARLVAPDTHWANTASQVRAATLYVLNWRLASDSTDYLAADQAPTSVQHYWSLSVEEQFYLFWPVLLLVLVLLARGLRRRTAPVVTAGMAAAVLASLWYSVHATDTNPARAYFVTTTRVWELALGGVLAALVSRRAFDRKRNSEAAPLPPTVRIALVWIGLLLIGFTCVAYSSHTPFPGWQALVPTIGAVMVIAAGDPSGRFAPGRVLALRPMQWLGDISYSVYLWHWPLIVLVPYASGGRLGVLDKLAIIGATLALAALSKRFVEDPFRAPRWGRPRLKPFALAAAGMTVVIVGTAVQLAEVHHRQDVAKAALARAVAGHGPCFGAAALAETGAACPRQTSGPIFPDPIQAANDKSHAYLAVNGRKDCFAEQPEFHLTTCTFGDRDGGVRVALVGNSHAGQWVDTLEAIAHSHHWRLDTYLASRCAFADIAQRFDIAGETEHCRDWVQRATAAMTDRRYDLIVMTNRISVPVVGAPNLADSLAEYQRGYAAVLDDLSAARLRVVGIRDTPAPGRPIPDCLAAHADDYSACDGTRESWLPPEPLHEAIVATGDQRIVEADLTDYICAPAACPAVIGTVTTYWDGSHLSATYARTLAPYLAPYLERALAG